jgi:diguanylate cyclase (GGDEF)-like protein/PAS domain S-box-containing protein
VALAAVGSQAGAERRINRVRVLVGAFSLLVAAMGVADRPGVAYATAAVMALTVAGVHLGLAGHPSRARLRRLGLAATATDALVGAAALVANLHSSEPSLWVVTLCAAFEMALRYQLLGGLVGGLVSGGATVAWSLARGLGLPAPQTAAVVTFRFGVVFLMATVVGWAFAAAARQNRAFRQTLKLSRDMVSILDTSGRVLYVNQASTGLVGYPPGELVGRPLASIPGAGALPPSLAAAPPGPRETTRCEAPFVRPDGSTAWLEHTVTPVPEHGLVHCVSRDVTERHERDQALAVIESRYRTVFDRNPDPVATLGTDGCFTDVNPAVCRLLGFERHELVGAPLSSFVHPDSARQAAELVDQLGTGRPGDFELSVRHRHGRRVEVMLTAIPLVGEAGLEGMFLVAKDQTERIKAQELMADTLERLRRSEERLRMALEETGTVQFEYEEASGTLRVSENLAALVGDQEPTGEALARSFSEHLHPLDRDRLVSAMTRAVGRGAATVDEVVRLRDGSGQSRWMHLRCRCRYGESGRLERLVGIAIDITERQVATDALVQSEQAFRATIEATTDAFVGADEEGRVTDWNAQAESLFGWSRQEALGRPLDELVVPPELAGAHPLARLAPRAAGLGDKARRVETTALTRSEARIPVEVTVTEVPVGVGRGLRAFVRDISERKAAEAELERRALIDPLTRLPNRALLMDRMAQAIARLERQEGSLAVLFVDIDRFKVVNDSLGHTAGDRLLRSLGERLPAAIRARDTVARFGGDELVVLCEQVADADEARQVAERVLAKISEPLCLDHREIVLTASVGISLAQGPDADPDELIRDADAAMYRAKARGRNRVELFSEQMWIEAVSHFDVQRDLRLALERGELVLEYQPVVSLFDQAVVGAEALLRWDQPGVGLRHPGEFLAVAEDCGLMVPIGYWVVEEACRQAARWAADPDPAVGRLAVLVNLSPHQISDPELPGVLAKALDRHGVDPSRLCVEITENLLMTEPEDTLGSLRALEALGVELLVDDFGTGWSSLMSLRQYPVRGLKVERTFTAGLGADPTDSAIVEGVVAMAHRMGLSVTVEGVETQQQVDCLARMGCDRAQGFYWSEARAADEVAALARRLGAARRSRLAPVSRPAS